MRSAISVTLLAVLACLIGCTKADKTSVEIATIFDASYATYSIVLSNYVDGDRVDYATLKANRAPLDTFVAQLANITPEQYDSMDTASQMSMWINAYNGITLRSIIDVYPVASIKDIDGVWDKKRWSVAGRQVTLDDIEHKLLRPIFNDPRIHFAVNCASTGCPPLLDRPFLSSNVDALLDTVALNFINDTSRTQVSIDNRILKITSIFDWFGDDFIRTYGSHREFSSLEPKKIAAINFVMSYYDDERADDVDPTAGWNVSYLDYDWSLNDIRH